MNGKDYVTNALKTEILRDDVTPEMIRLLHCALGLATEAGEFADMVKRHVFYGYKFDRINALEELGDSLWYMAPILDLLGSDFDSVMAANIAKLQFRKPEYFQNGLMGGIRDLASERQILERYLQPTS